MTITNEEFMERHDITNVNCACCTDSLRNKPNLFINGDKCLGFCDVVCYNRHNMSKDKEEVSDMSRDRELEEITEETPKDHFCSNLDCNNALGEIACGNNVDDGMYCSHMCSEVGKYLTLSHRLEKMEAKVCKDSVPQVETDHEKLKMWEEIKQLESKLLSTEHELSRYKCAYEVLVNTLKGGSK